MPQTSSIEELPGEVRANLDRLGPFHHQAPFEQWMKHLFAEFTPVFIAVFGSVPRGEANAYSDLDVFIVADDLPESPLDRYDALNAFLVPGIDFRPHTTPEFHGMVDRWDLTVLEVCHAHWFLYDPKELGDRAFTQFDQLYQAGKLVRVDFAWVLNM